MNKGIALKDLGNIKEAIECYNQAIKIDPNDVLAYCNRSKSHQILGNTKEAKIDLETAGKLLNEG
jgi:tetratricopeptide (TPR) repeat protein